MLIIYLIRWKLITSLPLDNELIIHITSDNEKAESLYLRIVIYRSGPIAKHF